MEMSYVDILRDIYKIRKKKNPAYSMSKFSRDAGFKSYHLSDVFAGRYGLSVRRATEVAEKLKMSDTVKKQFLRLVESNAAKSKEDKNISDFESSHFLFEADKKVSVEEFSLMSQWYFFALIELIRKLKTPASYEELAERLSISENECKSSIKKLIQLGYICELNGELMVNHAMISLNNDTPSEIIRNYHRIMIAKSLDSMQKDPVSERYFGSFNLNLSEQQYNDLHEELSAFIRKKITHYQKDVETEQRLYTLNFQLFPLEQIKK